MPKELPDYPTNEMLEEFLKAHKEGGEAGILELLKRQRAEKEKKAQKPEN